MPDRPPLTLRRADATIDVVSAFRALAARHSNVFWLDAGGAAAEGWSVLGVGEPDAAGPGRIRIDLRSDAADAAEGEPPFRGGWVGWLDYETGAATAGAPVAEGEGGAAWLWVEQAIAIDHTSGVVWVLGSGEAVDGWWLASTATEAPAEPARVEASARHDRHQYAALIERCREAIRIGTAYQLCLTTRFEVEGAHDPIETYLRLRSATPAHHGGFIRIGERSLLSASPETFLHAKSGRLTTRPIKGTRPRSADAATDAALATQLRESAKERAENVMIVDLMRNDLSRVCVPGTIRVDDLWKVESYPAVHQLVSTVSGIASPGLTVQGLWDAAFPAGSMTGAPKLSAMSVLHELEGRAPRGVYSGCFGYVGVDGSMDLAMVIRSILIEAGRAFVGAGGGITWGSEPTAEVEEVATKARAPLSALGAELPEAWRRR